MHHHLFKYCMLWVNRFDFQDVLSFTKMTIMVHVYGLNNLSSSLLPSQPLFVSNLSVYLLNRLLQPFDLKHVRVQGIYAALHIQ